MADTSNQEDSEDIVIEFEGNFDLDSIRGKKIQVIGIDTDKPVLQIETKFYRVDIKDSIGSRLILESDQSGKLKYHGKTDKVATARRVMIKPK